MRVLIIDDHPLYRRGVESLLFELDATVSVLDAGTVEEGLLIAGTNPVDLILLDLNLPGMSDLDALIQVKDSFPSVPTVVVSANDDAQLIWRSIENGAAGYIPKSTDQTCMIDALRDVIVHGIHVPPHALQEDGANSPGKSLRTPALSDRQLAVLKLLLQGQSNKAIAFSLGIAEGTVKAHLFSIYQSLGVNSRTQAMAAAFRHNLIKGG